MNAHQKETDPLVVAISGASGAIYATRLIELLMQMGQDSYLTISPPGALVLKQELDLDVSLDSFHIEQLLPTGEAAFDRCPATATAVGVGATATLAGKSRAGNVSYFHCSDFMAAIASGSCLTSGMVVCPCSGSTLSAVVTGASNNLIHRAADVHLKERRPLVLVPRETPLSQVALENMRSAGALGATILPAMPGWYHGVHSARDLVDFIVARILDQLGIRNELISRWEEPIVGASTPNMNSKKP